ncbi:MAG: hypothetical protein ACRD9L_12870, partial [Bryobacteraceae bacterium]
MNFRFPTFLLLASSTFAVAAAPYSAPEVVAKTGAVRTGTLSLPALNPRDNYSLLYSVDAPGALAADARIAVTLEEGATVLAHKTLHAGDPD